MESHTWAAGGKAALVGRVHVRKAIEHKRYRSNSLGTTTAQMHHHLARALGSSTPPAPGVLAQALRERAQWAFAELAFLESAVPGLRASAEALYTRLEALDRLDDATRIHGDYHLGQVLRP